MINSVSAPAFADVVFLPRWMEILPVVLIIAVVLLAAGLLIRVIGKKRKNKRGKEEDPK